MLLRTYLPKARVIWLTTLPTDETINAGRANKDIDVYNKLAKTAAEEVEGIEVLDLYGDYYQRRHEITRDGTHMKNEVYYEIAHRVAEFIRKGEK